MSVYADQVAGSIEAAAIRSATGFSWFGRTDDPAAEGVARLPAEVARRVLLHRLRGRLYDDFYCRGVATPSNPWRARPTGAVHPFAAELSGANTGRGSRERGWRVQALEAGQVVVGLGGLRLWVEPGQVEANGAGRPAPGDEVVLVLPKELPALSPGYHTVLGDAGLPADPAMRVDRHYWNLEPRGAVALVRLATARLNAAGLAFRLKVVNDPACYARCDSGVLYTPSDERDSVARLVNEIHGDIADRLRPRTPALTRLVAAGLGFAEDPGDGQSFGLHRCGLIAEGIVRAHERGERSAEDRFAVVAEHFAEAGVDIDAPYLVRRRG